MNTAIVARHLNIVESAITEIQEWAHVLFVKFVAGRPRFVSKKIKENSMFKGNVEYVQGQESHTSYWGKFYVKGLEEYACKEDDDRNCNDRHHNYQMYCCNDIPEGTVFPVFAQDGSKRGTDLFEFYVCKVSDRPEDEQAAKAAGMDFEWA